MENDEGVLKGELAAIEDELAALGNNLVEKEQLIGRLMAKLKKERSERGGSGAAWAARSETGPSTASDRCCSRISAA